MGETKNRSKAPVSLSQTAIRVIQLPNLGSIADLTPPTNAPVQKPPDVVCIPHPPGQKRDIPTRHARSPPPSQDPRIPVGAKAAMSFPSSRTRRRIEISRQCDMRQDQASCPVFHGILSPSDLSKSDFPVPTRRADQESSSGIGRVRSGYIRPSAEPADTSCG